MAAAQQSNQQKNQSAQQAVDQGLVGRSLSLLLRFVLFSLATLFFAILIEWGGMTFIWETEGPRHSAQMLNTELSYLSGDFKRSALVAEPVQFAKRFADTFYDIIFRKTGLERGIGPAEGIADGRRNPRGLGGATPSVCADPSARMHRGDQRTVSDFEPATARRL